MAESDPVFIWAPTQRCGTGLLQRLVTSSREVLVFGEERHLTLELPAQMLHCARPMADQSALREKLASGDPSGWYVHVYPPAAAYQNTLIRNFRNLVTLYADSAQEHGFGRWGTKYPRFQVREALVLSKLLPEARHLFVYRDIVDVLKSVKARGWLPRPEASATYCTQWAQGIQSALGTVRDNPRFHIIRYEDLTAQPEAHLTQLSRFLGVRGMDGAVFSHRPNTPQGQYTPPQPLTAAELAAVQPIAGSVRSALGYTSPLQAAG